MAAKGGKKGPGKKGANGYKMPDPINAGEILTDMAKKQWIIGKSIGVGGFGEIYSAAPYSGKLPKEYPAVIKIEPHGNGPLFVEMHFYMRNCKPDDIETWRKKKKLSSLGMPKFNGSGSHDYKGTKYRFVVMDRYGTDLWKLFLENNRKFSEHTVYKIAIQIIDVLEYIHNRTYIHADIKGANLLLDIKNSNQVYLVDFGLASHYTTKTDYKLDPKKAHNGTIEYTSRDAHFGIPTMRSDFEILAYNIIQWLAGSLPWEKNLKDPSSVQKLKEKAFDNLKIFLKECFGDNVPSTIIKYMDLLAQLEFNDTPDYDQFRDILVSGIKKLGYKVDGPLIFNDGGGKNNLTIQPDVTLKKTKKTTDTSSRRKSPRARLDTSPSTPLSPPPPPPPLLSSRRPKLPTTPSSSSSLRRPKIPVTPSSPPPPSSSTTTTPSTRKPRIPITPSSSTTTPSSTRRPRVPSTPSSPPVSSLLDDSCVGIVVDKKREKLKDMRKILESIDDDSDTEFDIVITKKKNKIPKLDKKIPEVVVARKQTVRKVRQKVVKNNSDADDDDDDDDFEPEVILPKATRTRKAAVKKVTTRKKKPVEKNNSDEEMFD